MANRQMFILNTSTIQYCKTMSFVDISLKAIAPCE